MSVIGWQDSTRWAISTVRGGKRKWRWALVALAAVLVAATTGYLAYGAYARPATLPAARPTVAAQRMPLATTVNARGTVIANREARLAFGTAGRVSEIRVRLGQEVEPGQVLATLATDDLQAQLAQAQSGLRVAELKLRQLKEIATPEEIEAAKTALAAAESRVEEVGAGARAGAIRAAELAVAAAEARLASATARRQELEAGVTPAARAEAAQGVFRAQAELQRAQAAVAALKAGPLRAELDAARLEIDRAKQTLFAEQVQRDGACGRGDNIACSAGNARVGGAELGVRQAELRLQALQAGPSAEELAAAASAVESARKGLESAEARRQAILAGATRAEILTARSDEELARANLSDAQAKLEELRAGASVSEVRSAEAARASAAASLAALTSRRAGDIALAEEDVRQAELAVRRAELAQDEATIKAPFGGVVAAINTNLGEQILASAPAITVVDPKAVRVDAAVTETDVAKLQVGQNVEVSFDALTGKTFGGKVAAVSSGSSLERGTPTYLASVDIDPGTIHLTPGMAATLNIITEQRDNVLMVPNRALRRQGDSQFVEVMVDGEPTLRPVSTGVSTGQSTEILAGLEEGETIVLPR